jgi:hypothetical protein
MRDGGKSGAERNLNAQNPAPDRLDSSTLLLDCNNKLTGLGKSKTTLPEGVSHKALSCVTNLMPYKFTLAAKLSDLIKIQTEAQCPTGETR